MARILNKDNLQDTKIKLFIDPCETYLIEDIRTLYPESYTEIYEVVPVGGILDDRAEFFCYDLWLHELPVLLICDAVDELNVLEIYKNFQI